MSKQKLRRFDVLTIFPEIITSYAEASILEPLTRTIQTGILCIT